MDTSPWATFTSFLVARHCKRAFLDIAVPRDLLESVLRLAAHAPSTRNGQPWQVAVVSGACKDALADRMRAELDRGVAQHPDYDNRLPNPDQATKDRAREANGGVLRAFGLTGSDARRVHLRNNLGFYGAPVEMIFHLRADATRGQFLELGFFVENVILGLIAMGLGSCPQYSVAGYPDVIRSVLGLGTDRIVVCGLAVGYPDESVPVNQFWPARAALSDYVQWHDGAPPSVAEQAPHARQHPGT